MIATARRRALLISVIGAVLLATGCATSSGNDLGGGAVGVDPLGLGMACDSGGISNTDPTGLVPLPADAVLVSAARCVFTTQPVQGDGEWMMRLDQNASTGLAALATALRLPSKSGDGACAGVGYIPIVITVTDQQGREIQPAIPRAACGGPLEAVTDAIVALDWSTVSTTKVRQVQSQLGLDSGCSDHFKPVIALVEPGVSRSGPLSPPAYLPATPLRVCRYGLDPDPQYHLNVGMSTLTVQGGKLVAASTLDGQPARSLLAAIVAAPAAPLSCPQREAPFAVIQTAKPEGGTFITVELGGCYRAMVDSDMGALRQLSAATVSSLMT